MSNKDAQEDFILQWCEDNHGFDALCSDFHDQFYEKFGGKRHECLFGAQTVYKAMRLAEQMHKSGKLNRGIIGLGGGWQPGFPKWVYVYSVPSKDKQGG